MSNVYPVDYRSRFLAGIQTHDHREALECLLERFSTQSNLDVYLDLVVENLRSLTFDRGISHMPNVEDMMIDIYIPNKDYSQYNFILEFISKIQNHPERDSLWEEFYWQNEELAYEVDPNLDASGEIIHGRLPGM